MHRTAFAGTKRRTRTTDARSLRTRTLKNRLTRDWTAWRRTHRSRGPTGLHRRRRRTRRGRFVHWPRAGLRNNHARSRRLRGPGRDRRRNRTRRRSGSRWLRRRRSGHRWRRGRARRRDHDWRRWRNNRFWRRCAYHRSGWGYRNRRNDRLFDDRRRNYGLRRSKRSRRNNRRRWCWRLRNRRYRRSNRRLRDDGRNYRTHRRRRSRCRFLFLRDGAQDIARTRNMRQIDLGFDFFFTAQRARGPGRRTLRFLASDMGPDLFCFMLLDRAGMRLLLGDAH